MNPTRLHTINCKQLVSPLSRTLAARLFDATLRFKWKCSNTAEKGGKALMALAVAVALVPSAGTPSLLWAQDANKPAEAKPAAKPATEQTTDKPTSEQQALHDKLAKYLSGTKWTGKFVMDGQDEARTEYYEILSAEKGEIGDYWNLIARIKYGGNDVTMPLPPIEIKFAGETPVITIDRVNFPGFGMFDARVVIRKGKYAGTWAHSGGVGGHLFGVIERMDQTEAKEKADEHRNAGDPKKE